MVIAIREGSDIPIYQQIRDQIVLGISDGRLTAGEQLPTVRALAEEIGINSMTVNKAYQLLKQQGYIITDRRNGARVSRNFVQSSRLSLQSRELLARIIAEAKVSGMTQEEFLEECKRCYLGGRNPESESNLDSPENLEMVDHQDKAEEPDEPCGKNKENTKRQIQNAKDNSDSVCFDGKGACIYGA